MRFGTWNKLDLREIGIDGANWIQLAQRAFVNTVMKFRVPYREQNIFDKQSAFLIIFCTIK
jgi:hypothetical protein